MNIGYACQAIGVPFVRQRTCIMKNASPEVLIDLIDSNLRALDNILDYNIINGIKLFRISSNIIPFGSHPQNTLKWWEIFSDELSAIGRKATQFNIRLSMHPGQYSVINSPDPEVVKRAVDDLRYHTRLLDAIGVGQEHKIILHIGGIYGDKAQSVERFINEYRKLDQNIKNRLVIENDDRQYNIKDVLSISECTGIPVVFDNLHHLVYGDDSRSMNEWIICCNKTWKKADGNQKMHYSQQDFGKRPGAHSETINVDEFFDYYAQLPVLDADIMVEVKDKNLSALKCLNAINSPQIKRIEKEWSRYKYLILEHSPEVYHQINNMLKDKSAYPVKEFYRLVDEALLTPIKSQNEISAAHTVWEKLEEFSDLDTKDMFVKYMTKLKSGNKTTRIKQFLFDVSVATRQSALINSLYFIDVF